MSTGTSSLRRTKRRGAALVAACAAALVAALAGPAWAGSVPTARRSTGRAARPGIAADRGGADEGVVARGPDDSGRRNRGVDSDARRTPGGADDARDAKGECTHGRRQDEQGHDAGADEHRDPATRADVRLYDHREHRGPAACANPQLHDDRRHHEARACRRLCAPGGPAKAETASRPTGERNEAGFAGARGCRGPAGRQPPRPADRDAHALVRRLRPGSDRNARSRGAPARGRGRGRPRRGRRRPPSRSDRVSPMRILGLALVAVLATLVRADMWDRPLRHRRRHATAVAAAAGSGRT